MYQEQIKKLLFSVLNSEDGDSKTLVNYAELKLGIPTLSEFGDYTTNIAMQSFQRIKAHPFGRLRKHPSNFSTDNPMGFARNIKSRLEKMEKFNLLVEKIKVVAPGFINFYLKKDVLVDSLIHIDKEYGKGKLLKGKRINFEFGQPNTHKMPHIGHLFSYVLGHSLTNILEFSGANVYRVNYQGDIGPHVAKCLWAFQKESPPIPKNLEEKVKLLQKMYQTGSKAYEDEKVKKEIDSLNKLIYEKDESILDLYQKTRKWSIDYYKQFEKRLGIKYDRYFFESEVEQKGREGVEKALGKVFKKSEGAIIFEGSRYGLHDRVFVTKYGTPTYEAKDTYLEVLKYKEWPYDLMIITTASEQNEYFKVVYKAIEKLEPKLMGKLKHIGFGMVSLTTGKMSSRTGQIVGAVDLVEMAKKETLKINSNEKIAETVAIGAVKYAFLKSNPLQNIKFDIKESVSLEGNSGPYLQYTVARTNSVLAKRPIYKGPTFVDLQGYTLQSEEEALLRTLVHFPEVVAEAATNYASNLVCNYLYQLASQYNTFYNAHKIIGGENEEFKLLLTQKTGTVLRTGLRLLGIQTPNHM